MQLHLTQLLTRILGATLIMIGCATHTADAAVSAGTIAPRASSTLPALSSGALENERRHSVSLERSIKPAVK